MSIIRDMRSRIEDLEARECSCSSAWPDACAWIAFWMMLAAVSVAASYSASQSHPEPVRPDPSVECIKVGGEWSWNACRRVAK